MPEGGLVVKLAAVAACSAVSLACGTPGAGAAPLPVADRMAIAQTVTDIGLYSDMRDWDRVLRLLADQVTTDYTSLFGGAASTVPRADVVAQWRSALEGFDATQHQITNVTVTGSGAEASALSHVRATHWIDGKFWTVGGVYTHRLARAADGWRVTYMAIQRLYEEGDRSVFEHAANRPAT